LKARSSLAALSMRSFAVKAVGRDDHDALDSGKKEKAKRYYARESTDECKDHL